MSKTHVSQWMLEYAHAHNKSVVRWSSHAYTYTCDVGHTAMQKADLL